MVRRTAFFKKSDPKTKTLKAYNTGYSQAVSQPGTNLALQGLTAVVRREPVRFLWCGRRRKANPKSSYMSRLTGSLILRYVWVRFTTILYM